MTKLYITVQNQVYEKAIFGKEVCVLVYQLRATFHNPVVAAIFPNAEIVMLFLLPVLIIMCVICTTIRTARKMERGIRQMQSVASKIEEQDLDFTVSMTDIKEFNGVLATLEQLKASLADSLRTQWALEQEQRTQMSALAHNVKTPLTIIEGNAQMLLESELPNKEQAYAEYIDRNAEQVHTYVNQILDITNAHTENAQNTTIQTQRFLKEVLADAQALAVQKQVEILEETPSAPLLPQMFQGDEFRLKRVFSNVFSNAIRHTPKDGIVRVSNAYEEKDGQIWIRCTIEDSGKGFSSEALLHAKELFYQGNPSRSEKEHYGMGLYIAEQLVNDAGGVLTIANSQHGRGMVTIEFPVSSLLN